LAWELAAAAHPHLSRVDADRIYTALGIGETFAAIDALITAIARDRQLIAEVKTCPPQQIPAAKEPPESLPVTRQYRYRRSGSIATRTGYIVDTLAR
jgi:hypothetical protein